MIRSEARPPHTIKQSKCLQRALSSPSSRMETLHIPGIHLDFDSALYLQTNSKRIIIVYCQAQPPMNSDLSNSIEEQQQTSFEESWAEPSRIGGAAEKKNYCGLQDDSRKKSKKKHWKPQENRKYVDFLRENSQLFEKNREDKRLMKINILMSNHVRSKNSTQCRSHHQKMLSHYKSIENIIRFLCTETAQEQNETRHASVPVAAEQEIMEEFEESSEETPLEKDIFEVLSTNCWGYTDFFEGF